MDLFPSDRRGALQRLEEFVAAGVTAYGQRRNSVLAGHGNVSRLSAAVRHRLIAEEEMVAAVLAAHRFEVVEKFVQEVLWRTYWKGWLEQRPGVWADYLRQSSAAPPPEAKSLLTAGPSAGAMGFFTAELRDTGYLHNHARMWWAGWWCHQQRLPWAAGARFFFDHLLDGDPASNTLGWRWVAGLQTPGKAYLARPDNVAKYWPDHGALDDLDDAVRAAIPAETADRTRVTLPEFPAEPSALSGRVALLGHVDDLSIETTALRTVRTDAVGLVEPAGLSDGEAKRRWRSRAMDDAAQRWSEHYGQPVERLAGWSAVTDWVRQARVDTLVLMAPFVGPEADAWAPVRSSITAAGHTVIECRRPWDRELVPAARAGFFPFWHKVRPLAARRRLP